MFAVPSADLRYYCLPAKRIWYSCRNITRPVAADYYHYNVPCGRGDIEYYTIRCRYILKRI